MKPRIRPSRRRLVAAAAVMSIGLLAPGLSLAQEGPTPSVATRPAPIWPWMRRAAPAHLRDIRPQVGLRPRQSSYTTVTRDVNDDGWTDVFIGHHGSRPAELFLNVNDGTTSSGLDVDFHFRDTIHGRRDRHGCTIDDVDLDGLDDVFCAKGARNGTARKWNELWIQGPEGRWTDRAHRYGVEDIWGRGRFPRFIDLNHDRWPDLFLGNDTPRKDRHRTVDRTFINHRGERFREVRLGVTREVGDTCTDLADYDHNGWQDLLVCGRYRLFLYRRHPDGFVDATTHVNLPRVQASEAMFANLDRDHRLDLVVVTFQRLTVRLQRPDHTFGPVVATRPLQFGHGLAVGDPNGDGDQDIYVVQGCVRDRNMDDWLLMNDGSGHRFRSLRVAPVRRGCGDTAATLDFDRDGRDDFVVLNGGGRDQPLDRNGPDQLLTMGDWHP